MANEIIDFKTVKLNCKVEPSIGAELQITSESRVSARANDDFDGFVFLYLNIKLHDQDDTYFVFDITTESVFQIGENAVLDDALMEQLLEPAKMRSFEAIRDISTGMGINPIDLTGEKA